MQKRLMVIIHNPVDEHSSADERDVLVQADSVAESLLDLGYQVEILPFTLGSMTFIDRIKSLKPECVFNLVESVEGDARLIHVAPAYCDHLGVAFTGAKAESMLLTSNKVLSKKWMQCSSIPTSQWFASGSDCAKSLAFPDNYIIKGIWEEASVGLDDNSIVTVKDQDDLARKVYERSRELGIPCFAESFIDGREFNLSLLAKNNGVDVLPPAEIIFDLPPGKRKIVDYRAKWDVDSGEYQGTRRSFDFLNRDNTLIERLKTISVQCWHCFELHGYARVDFRLDAAGRAWVLEINANPCIAPDSGFVAAAQRTGLTHTMLVERIVNDAMQNKPIDRNRRPN